MKTEAPYPATNNRPLSEGCVGQQRRPRGQVMALGCVTMLLLALSLMMSFSVANAVHERIRIQSHSDAMAFSMAVVEARAMNYIAYSNRAIAAAFVSMTSAHAYAAVASSSVTLMEAGQMAMYVALGLEIAMCIATEGARCCDHIMPVWERADKYGQSIDKYKNKVKQIEQPLNDAVKAFAQLANDIHASQQSMVDAVRPFIESGSGLESLGTNNAPCAQNQVSQVASLNVGEFACAMEGSSLDNEASKHKRAYGDSCPGASELDNRRRIMSNVVNAARPAFLRTPMPFSFFSPSMGPPFFKQDFIKELMKDNPDPQMGMGTGYKVEGWLTDNICSAANNQSKGDASCAKAGDGTFFLFIPEDLPGVGTTSNAYAGSNQSGGGHKPQSVHSGQHSEYKGLFASNAGAPCNDGNCFINFRMDKADSNWGQPAVYSCISQSLRDWTTSGNQCNQSKQAWELNQQKTVSIEHGQREKGKLKMVPERDGYAASKALVYFHRMDDWKFPPNLFDPYWRAKMHPFSDKEWENIEPLCNSNSQQQQQYR